MLLAVLIGSGINIPIKTWYEDYDYIPPNSYFQSLISGLIAKPHKKILAINLGGAIIPTLISLWQIKRLFTEFASSHPQGVAVFVFVFLLNTYVCNRTAKMVPYKGITIPAFIPPITVAIPTLLLAPDIAPIIAFPAGVLGVLLGADILHLNEIKNMPGPGGSIGGAGTFDGVFLSGIISVFLTG